MTDQGPDDSLPGEPNEVPDWFATSEESSPVVNESPDEEPSPPALPADEEADRIEAGEGELDEEAGDEYDEPEEEEVEEALPPAPPIRTRRRRPGGQPTVVTVAPSGRGYACADVITAIFLLLTILVISATILLLANPRSALNPLQPPTYPAILVLATELPTNTPTQTFTPEPATPTPIPSATPTHTLTPTPTVTNTPVVGGGTLPTVTQTVRSAPTEPPFTLSPFPFTVKPLRYMANTTQDGCQWQSIAGSVVDMANKPIKGLAIRVTGSNGNIDEVHYSGTEARFGEGGFEVFLGATPREDEYTIQLLGRTGAPISDAIDIKTKASCDQNVVIVSFTQNHPY
jgi:hypothetical protein